MAGNTCVACPEPSPGECSSFFCNPSHARTHFILSSPRHSHSTPTLTRSANGGYYPINFYIHLGPHGKLFSRGDFIMLKNLPEIEFFNPNGMWFRCQSEDRNTPHFYNPGALYKNPRSVDW